MMKPMPTWSKDDIDQMEDGRELDALVYVYVMGGDPKGCLFPDGTPRDCWHNPYGEDEDTFYSTDIAMAWLVVEKLRSRGFDTWLHIYDTFTLCEFFKHFPEKMESAGRASAPTAALAICRAALKVHWS